jgi:hypothetical protein
VTGPQPSRRDKGGQPRISILGEGRANHQVHRCLDDAVADCRDAEVALAAVAFGAGEAEERERLVAAAEEPVLQPVDLAVEIRRELADRHAVGAMTAMVFPDALEGVMEIDLVTSDQCDRRGRRSIYSKIRVAIPPY